MKRPLLVDRLARHRLYTHRWELRSSDNDALVAFADPPTAEAIADRLDAGLSLEHALRAVRAVAFRRVA